MAFHVPEQDDDAARVEMSQVKLLGLTVTKLLGIKPQLTGLELRFMKAMDTRLNVFGEMPHLEAVRTIKDLAWKYRRLIPAPIAPKLPPHDPVVQEMENTK